MAQSGHPAAHSLMSAFGGKPDIDRETALCPLLTQSGHLAPGFRTIQANPKDLPGSPQQTDGAVD